MQIIHNKKIYKKRRRYLRNNMTTAEVILWTQLRNKQVLGYKFRRQHGIGKYIVDFYCYKLNLVIEIDGSHHGEFIQYLYDERRTKYFNSLGIRVIRYWNHEVINDLEGVLEDIVYRIKK